MVFGKLKQKYEKNLAARRGKKVAKLQKNIQAESAKAYQREKISKLEKEHTKQKSRGRAPQVKGKSSGGAMSMGRAFFENAGRQSLMGAPMQQTKTKPKPRKKVRKKTRKLKRKSTSSKYVIIKGVAYKRG